MLAIAAYAACAACSLLVDTDGLDDPTADAGLPKPLGPDAHVELADADVGKTEDAPAPSVEAGADAETLGFCERHAGAALFCDDFDQPGRTNMKSEGWGGVYDYKLGDPTPTKFFSPPQSAYLNWNWVDSGTGNRNAAQHAIAVPSNVKSIKVSLRVWPGTATPAGQIYFGLVFGNCAIIASTGGVTMSCTAPLDTGYEDFGLSTPSYEKWNLQVITLKVRPDGADATSTIGEGSSAITSSHSINVAPDAGAPPIAQIGIGDAARDSLAQMYFDDILVEAN